MYISTYYSGPSIEILFSIVYWVLEIGIFHPKIKLKISIAQNGALMCGVLLGSRLRL
jgi:hypothetical protein